MSFSSQIKEELCRLPLRAPHCAAAELAGVLHAGSVLTLGSGGPSLCVDSESADAARRIMSLISKVYRAPSELSVRVSQPKNRQTFRVRTQGSELVMTMLADGGLSVGGAADEAAVTQLCRRECCRAAFLRGAFLGGGSMSDPKKGFHLEILTGSADSSKILLKIMEILEIKASVIERRGSYVVYLKGGEYITRLLTLTGAHGAVMETENIRIVRDIRNNANRQTNCVDANTDKTVRAAGRQAEDIRLVLESGARLSPGLEQTARLRLENPEASLSELAELMDGVTRSGINHRLRRLSQLARDIRGDDLF